MFDCRAARGRPVLEHALTRRTYPRKHPRACSRHCGRLGRRTGRPSLQSALLTKELRACLLLQTTVFARDGVRLGTVGSPSLCLCVPSLPTSLQPPIPSPLRIPPPPPSLANRRGIHGLPSAPIHRVALPCTFVVTTRARTQPNTGMPTSTRTPCNGQLGRSARCTPRPYSGQRHNPSSRRPAGFPAKPRPAGPVLGSAMIGNAHSDAGRIPARLPLGLRKTRTQKNPAGRAEFRPTGSLPSSGSSSGSAAAGQASSPGPAAGPRLPLISGDKPHARAIRTRRAGNGDADGAR